MNALARIALRYVLALWKSHNVKLVTGWCLLGCSNRTVSAVLITPVLLFLDKQLWSTNSEIVLSLTVTTWCDCLQVVTHHWTYPAYWLASMRWPGLSQLGQIQWFIQIPQGVITPQFSCDTPNHLKFKGGYQGGVYGGCLCDRDGRGNKQ